MTLDVRNLTVGYGGSAVVSEVSATFRGGEVTAIIGPNGAGKSTLLKAVAGLQTASGEIRVDGRPATGAALRRGTVAYMPQDTSATSSLTLLEVVLLGRLRSLGVCVPVPLIEEAASALGRFGLASQAERTLDTVSGGQRQLVYLAQALFGRPRVLLLDEPTAALDLRHQLIVLETVRETARSDGIAVGVAMHDLSLAAQFADVFLCLSGGRVEDAGPAERVLTPERLRAVYGVEVELSQSAQGLPIVTPLRAVAEGNP